MACGRSAVLPGIWVWDATGCTTAFGADGSVRLMSCVAHRMAITLSVMSARCWTVCGPKSRRVVVGRVPLHCKPEPMSHVTCQDGSESRQCARTSRTNGPLRWVMSGVQGGRYVPSRGTAPTPGGGAISCRRQNRGYLPRDAMREKLAL